MRIKLEKHAIRAGSVSDRTRGADATPLAVPIAHAPGSENRRAFTLVEMLIVVSILMIITVAVVAVAPRFTDDRKLSRAADGLAQWLLTAKQRAYRDQIPTGIRLFLDPQHNGLITEAQYIQQPDDFKGGQIMVGPNPSSPSGFAATAVGSSVDFTGGFNDPTLQPVQLGDYLEVKGNGLVHQIIQVTSGGLVLAPVAPSQIGNLNAGTQQVQLTNTNQLAVGMSVYAGATPLGNITNILSSPPSIVLSQPAPSSGPTMLTFLPPYAITPSPTAEYRIIRSPRVLTGETPLQLPAGICIDPSPKISSDPYAFNPNPSADIMFSPQGGVLNSGGRDAIILWVRDYTKDYPTNPGEQFLVLIQTHTGFIAQHPVDTSSPDPYSFTKDARSSGL